MYFFRNFRLFDVGQTERSVLFRLVDTIQQTLALFFLGKMQHELYDPCPVSVEVLFEIDNPTVAVLPDGLLVEHIIGQALTVKDFRVHTNDQDLLIVRAVEDADPPAFRQAL